MSEILRLLGFLDVIVLPLLGFTALVMSRVCEGDLRQQWEKHFLVTLIVVTCVTIRTVMYSDDDWLIHMLTLASMILAALLIPNQRPMVAAT